MDHLWSGIHSNCLIFYFFHGTLRVETSKVMSVGAACSVFANFTYAHQKRLAISLHTDLAAHTSILRGRAVSSFPAMVGKSIVVHTGILISSLAYEYKS